MIKCHNLNLLYEDDHAVIDMNLVIEPHEFVCILGSSGSGKSSLLGLIAGIKKPTTGTVSIDGEIVKSPRLKTSIILQDYGLLPWKNVVDNITFPLKTRNQDIDKDRFKEITDLLGISNYLNRFPHQLSGGQKQRIAIARTLCLESDVILMDEAFSALDFVTKESLQDLMLHIHKKQKQTIVFVTHSIEEALYLGQKIIIMENGSVKNILINHAWKQRDSKDTFKMMSALRGCLYD